MGILYQAPFQSRPGGLFCKGSARFLPGKSNIIIIIILVVSSSIIQFSKDTFQKAQSFQFQQQEVIEFFKLHITRQGKMILSSLQKNLTIGKIFVKHQKLFKAATVYKRSTYCRMMKGSYLLQNDERHTFSYHKYLLKASFVRVKH